VDVKPIPGALRSQWTAPNQRATVETVAAQVQGRGTIGRAHRCDRFRSFQFRAQKKTTGHYSAERAALGGRTLKCGQSRFFVGYKKHTFRLWLQHYQRGVLLVPLVSWAAPANVSEGGFLKPSVIYCQQRWQWRPDVVVADMGYIDASTKQQLREGWQVAVVTRMKENMRLVPPFESCERVVCEQGQTLEWLGYEPSDQLHWFGVTDTNPLCSWCWQSVQCARQFSYKPAEHETLLGLIPMNTKTSQRLLQQVRPWIEPAQSYEKNQLGLSEVFLNSLRLTWTMSLLADAAVLLRARVILETPRTELPMYELTPSQLVLELEN
jgi:hypothetical protein